ncbi:SDR family NAD(P)-dependent oxidoreductase [Variovorax defluvii]|uniref:SDR family NAD(P)-dependent oxidoreductase n=1 Tax=Variovorax defluvii TaxID=913761 RepID=UPI0031ECDC11
MTATEISLAVVTGGAGGIGNAVARRLLEGGSSVVIIDSNQAALDKALAAFSAFEDRVHARCVDVRDPTAVQQCADDVEASIGPVDALATCAGVTRSGPAEAMSFANWKLVLDVNLDGTFLCCQAFGKGMLARGRGAIVTISSTAGLGGASGRANYSASKHAVIGLTKTLGIEWGRRGVRVNVVAPGPVNTEMLDRVPERVRFGTYVARTPLARLAGPEEIAETVRYLLSPAASYVNAAVIPVDGGYSSGFATSQSGADFGV